MWVRYVMYGQCYCFYFLYNVIHGFWFHDFLLSMFALSKVGIVDAFNLHLFLPCTCFSFFCFCNLSLSLRSFLSQPILYFCQFESSRLKIFLTQLIFILRIVVVMIIFIIIKLMIMFLTNYVKMLEIVYAPL